VTEKARQADVHMYRTVLGKKRRTYDKDMVNHNIFSKGAYFLGMSLFIFGIGTQQEKGQMEVLLLLGSVGVEARTTTHAVVVGVSIPSILVGDVGQHAPSLATRTHSNCICFSPPR